MKAWDELVQRCALARRQKLGGLSDQAFAELVLAVRENPVSFVDSPAEQAFLEVAKALDAYSENLHDDDLLDDDAFAAARDRRLATLTAACEHAAGIDANCLDARLIGLLAKDLDPDPLLEGLIALEKEFGGNNGDKPLGLPDPTEDPWPNVLLRPRLRLRAAVSRCCLDGARFKMATAAADSVMDACRTDPLGCRYTAALAYARLEDEASFDALDARFGRQGSPWSHLAHVILLYKLDRMPAARRALRGYNDLCPGGAYALLRPTYVEVYLPDRPDDQFGGFGACAQAVREAEPIIADVPDFIDWCQAQDWLVESARRFADEQGFDWDDYDPE